MTNLRGPDSTPTFLVTGGLGCIGAWTLFHLVKQEQRVVSFDLDVGGHRVDALLDKEAQRRITFVRGDLVNTDQVLQVFKDYHITHVVHLAALQVPFCRADPVKGALVNVVGTVNIFEAARQTGVMHVGYASSISVYGQADDYPPEPVANDAAMAPTNLYGVYKQADEGIARIYWQDHKIGSTALRPYTVYGIGRDQGLTSDPTKAMLAAAAGQPFHINFGGAMQLQYASDVALQFIDAARYPLAGAFGFNLGGESVRIADVVSVIKDALPGAQITQAETALPFPEAFDDREIRKHFSKVYSTPTAEGIRQTLRDFQKGLAEGRIKPPKSQAAPGSG